MVIHWIIRRIYIVYSVIFMNSLFKSEESKAFLALAYITGILPIKKIRDESALNNFREYTMLDSYPITEYFGFTEDEVKDLCDQYGMDFDIVKAWYNGYLILGYLAFDEENGYAYIPNYEVSKAYQAALNKGSWSEIAQSIPRYDEVLRATIEQT